MTTGPDLDDLRLLVTVDELGSISRAAKALGVSQPAATTRLRRLETRHQINLVRRAPQGSSLTEDGQAVCTWARQVLREAEVLESGLHALSRRRRGDLAIAASLTIAEQLMPQWLSEIRDAHPGIHVSLSVVNSADVHAAVVAGRATVGFVETPGRLVGTHSRVVGRDRLLVLVPPGHRWTRSRRPITREVLRQETFVLRERGSGTRVTFTRALGEEPRVALEAGSSAAVLASAAGGIGPGVVSELSATEHLRTGRLVEVPVDVDLRRTLRAIWPSGTRLRGPAEDLLQIARPPAGDVTPRGDGSSPSTRSTSS
jgi:molybdate transport repressor ModE-like protein